jgi:hypothetical protein
MKKLGLALLIACAVAALWPAASLGRAPARHALQPLASSPEHPASGVRFTLPQGLREVAHARGLRTPARGAPVVARGVWGPCTVTGRVLEYGGDPAAAAQVVLYYADAEGAARYFDWVTADGNGEFAFTAVPETGNGMFFINRRDGGGYQSWGNAFTAGGANDFVVQPGLAYTDVWRTGEAGWDWWRWLRVETYGSRGGGTTWIDADQGDGGDVYAMAPDCGYAVAYPYDNQGIEWSAWSPLAIIAGQSSGDTMDFDQDDGRGAWIQSPYWGSGKPGTRTTLVLDGWPAGYQISLYGYSQGPSARLKDWPYYVESDGSHYSTLDLTIPATVPAGYDYEVHVYRYDDQASALDLTLYFQVASLNASRTGISRGGSVSLSGVVPTQGHMGGASGKSKDVTIYQRTGSAGPPTTWDATRKGWSKVATVRTNGYGKFVSGSLRPAHTTWYIARYPGDDWYHRAYTSVVKVVVR